MEIKPLMDIWISASNEDELLAAMRNKAAPPWRWQAHDAFERPAAEGSFYFRRDRCDPDPSCTLCMRRQARGHLVVSNIVPDADTVHTIPRDQYVRILQEFDTRIAGPAAEALGGMTSIGTATQTLEDHFSPEAVRLLERFCKTSNVGDRGSHPSDQERWMDFLLHVHRENTDVDCDTFGKCLRAKECWPDDGIAELVHEYDFAMRLLRQRDK